MRDGRPSVCVPDPILGRCVPPYRTTSHLQQGGPHAHPALRRRRERRQDGRLHPDGDRRPADVRRRTGTTPACASYLGPAGPARRDELSHRPEIPNYWTYAREFVLQDHMFAPADSYTLPAHLFLISAWAARCRDPRDPMSCVSNLELFEELEIQKAREDVPIWAWTDITYLLHEQDVRWGYYVGDDTCFFGPVRAEREPRADGDAADPAAVVHHGSTEPPDAERDRGTPRTSRPPRTGRCPRCRGCCRTRVSVSTRATASRSGRACGTSRRSSTPRCGDPTGRRPRSSSPGTTGVGSTTTSSRRAST